MVEAGKRANKVVVTIFVNPLQFAGGDDFSRYPRTREADEDFLALVGVDAVFIPSVDEIYPGGRDAAAVVRAGSVGAAFEGESRPGHFDGVLTVVHRLFDIVSPEIAVFGRKDAQQLFVIEAMVAKLGLPIDLVAVETVRAEDGLALSSRNRYLSAEERQSALVLPQALHAASTESTPAAAVARALAHVEKHSGVVLDYLEIVDPVSFQPCTSPPESGQALLIAALWVGNTRLLDNRLVHFPQ